MKNILGIQSLWLVLILLGVAAFIGFSFPSYTHAAELSSQTAQLLPIGQTNTCPVLNASGFTPYIYDGALHSFEFSVSDSSYVAIAASVGAKGVPFKQMVRRPDAPGALRVHVDIETTPLRNGLPIQVTMLSAKSGQPVCISIVATALPPQGGTVTLSPTSKPAPVPAPAPVQPTPPSKAPTPGSMKDATATTSVQNFLKDICAAGGAPRLWFVLLVVYALLVAGAIFGRTNMPVALRSQEWIAAMIVVPFLLLFGIWYFVESCRVSAWVPILATLIALAGLAAAFWDKSTDDTPIINLPAAGGEKK